MTASNESEVEQAASAWIECAGWQVRTGAEIAPGESAAERDDDGFVVLLQRLRESFLPPVSCDLRLKGIERLAGKA